MFGWRETHCTRATEWTFGAGTDSECIPKKKAREHPSSPFLLLNI